MFSREGPMDDLLNFAREARAKADMAGRPILVSFRGTSQLVYPGIPPEVICGQIIFTTKNWTPWQSHTEKR